MSTSITPHAMFTYWCQQTATALTSSSGQPWAVAVAPGALQATFTSGPKQVQLVGSADYLTLQLNGQASIAAQLTPEELAAQILVQA